MSYNSKSEAVQKPLTVCPDLVLEGCPLQVILPPLVGAHYPCKLSSPVHLACLLQHLEDKQKTMTISMTSLEEDVQLLVCLSYCIGIALILIDFKICFPWTLGEMTINATG